MDVQDAVGKRLEQPWSDEAHEAGEAHQIDPTRAKHLRDRRVVRVAIVVVARVQVQRLDASTARTPQPCGIGAVRNHNRDGCREPAACNGVDDCLKVAAAAGDQDAEPGGHTYLTDRSPATTNPRRNPPRSPACDSILTTRCASLAAQAMTSPTPMLKARNISSVAMPPRRCSTSKIGGTCHERRSISAAQPSGRMRGRFSVMPPPVMCAIPFT